MHVVSESLEDASDLLATLAAADDAPTPPIVRADEVLRPEPGSARAHPRDARIIPRSRDFH